MTMRSISFTHRRLVAGLSVLVIGTAGLTVVTTNALFTDSATVTAGAFTTGTVNLTAAPATTTLLFANMAPGDKVTAPITVTNTGSLQMRYAMTNAITGSGPLAAALTFQIKTVAAAGNCNDAGWAAGGAVVGPIAFGTAAPFGSTSQGFQAGDRTLNSLAAEVLCAQVIFPLGSGNALQSLTTSGTFTFTAEQTANN